MTRWTVVVVALITGILVSSGCIGTPSTPTSTNNTNSETPKSGVTLPKTLSFTSVLTITRGNATLMNYSYSAIIDYSKMNAQVNFTSVSRPGMQGLTGNWHHKRIIIENGSSVRMFVAPPAAWMPVPENQTEEIIESVFHSNPYVIIFNSTSKSINCSECSLNVTLSPEVSALLLAQFVGANNAPNIPMEGVIVVKDSVIVSANFTGVFEDKTYSFSLEVKDA